MDKVAVDYLKRNERLMIWLACLIVFSIVDYYIREQLFEASIPYLQAIVPYRPPLRTKLAAFISELSDKYAYIVFIAIGY